MPMSNTYYPGTFDRVEVFDTAAQSVVKVINLTQYGYGCTYPALTPDDSRLYVTCRWTNNVIVIDTDSYDVLDTIRMVRGDRAHGPAITSDGKKLYVPTRSGGGYVNIIDIDPTSPTYHRVIKTVYTGLSTGNIGESVFSPDETRLYFTFPNADKLVTLDTTIDEIYAITSTEEEPSEVAVTPDGKYVYLACYDANVVQVFDAVTMALTDTIQVEPGPWDIVILEKGPSTPAEVADEVREMLDEGCITNHGVANAIISSLENAQRNLETSPRSAANMLGAAVNKIEAQAGKKICSEGAEELIGYLETIAGEL